MSKSLFPLFWRLRVKRREIRQFQMRFLFSSLGRNLAKMRQIYRDVFRKRSHQHETPQQSGSPAVNSHIYLNFPKSCKSSNTLTWQGMKGNCQGSKERLAFCPNLQMHMVACFYRSKCHFHSSTTYRENNQKQKLFTPVPTAVSIITH